MAGLLSDSTERVVALDAIRGIAVLGIFAINLSDMAYPEDLALQADPTGKGGLIDYWILSLSEALFSGKMRGLFAVLFGISAALIVSGLARTTSYRFAASAFYRRLIWLAVFGLVNAYLLLWWGDILFKYAVLGVLLFPLSFLTCRVLALISMVCLALLVSQPLAEYRDWAVLKTAHEQVRVDRLAGRAIDPEQARVAEEWRDAQADRSIDYVYVEEEISTRSGGYLEIFLHNAVIALEEQTIVFVDEDLLDLLPYMIIGLAIAKSGILTGASSGTRQLSLASTSVVVGFGLHFWLTQANIQDPLDLARISLNAALFEISRFPFVLGYFLLIFVVVSKASSRWLITAISATGRMALSNYLTQSVIALFLLNGFGWGQFGLLPRLDLALIFACVCVAQVGFSVFWLRRFKQGPFEWLWRSLTSWELKPLRRSFDQ